MRVLVIDDHAAMRFGIERAIADDLDHVEFGHAKDAQEAIQELRNGHWDVAVLDLNLPGQGGLELIRVLKDEAPKLGVLVYTMHSVDHFGARALRAGADGYLTKDSPIEELPKAVVEIFQGRRYLSSMLEATVSGASSDGASPHEKLSDREFEILQKIGQGKSPTEIARELSLSVKTVSTYRSHLLEKLGLRTTADLIRYAVDQRIV